VALAAVLAAGTTACGGGSSPGAFTEPQTATTPVPASTTQRAATMLANTPMSRRVLSGRFRVPGGFVVRSVNPVVPSGAPGYGSVAAVVISPTGVEYDVTFSPTTIPCLNNACTTVTRSIPVGTANPPNAQAIFSPEIGIAAECGFDPDGHQVGCDTIVKDEYVAVRSTSSAVSTADAVAILRAAVTYVQGLTD